MTPLPDALWGALLAFVFYWPLFMSFLWMIGATMFWWRHERGAERQDRPRPLPGTPPVSVLIPSYNEGENAEETLSHALALDYPDFEVIAINDGSKDDTGAVLERMAARHPRLRVVHLAKNQGKAVALQAGSLLARHEILICIDGDALLDRHAAHWFVRHFVECPSVGAVTGNPRIRNRSTLLGRLQVGEFSAMVGMIKRAQRSFGRLFTVSGVVAAFRKSAVHQVGYWSADMLTEDIDITWKLQRAGWDVRFEPNALTWILMPETLKGLWRQRLRWAMGGAQVLFKNLDVLGRPSVSFLWPLLAEMLVTIAWCYSMVLLTVLWLHGIVLPGSGAGVVGSPLAMQGSGVILGTTCLLQFAIGTWLDRRYERGLARNLFWMIWYPFAFWVINTASMVVAYPKVLVRRSGRRARWVSPDRGVRP